MTNPLTLEQAKVGDQLRILQITDPETATNALRLGISAGEVLHIASKVPGGPVVIRRAGIEIALGRELCKSIQVANLTENPELNPDTNHPAAQKVDEQ